MKKTGTSALLILLVGLLLPVALQGQAAEQQAVLVWTGSMFVTANPDSTRSTTAYAVPAGQELCLTDILWAMNGTPNSTLTMTLLNASADRTSSWSIWAVTPTLSGIGDASGLSSFQSGPKITSGGEIAAVFPAGLSGAAFTLYGKQRAISTAPCS